MMKTTKLVISLVDRVAEQALAKRRVEDVGTALAKRGHEQVRARRPVTPPNTIAADRRRNERPPMMPGDRAREGHPGAREHRADT